METIVLADENAAAAHGKANRREGETCVGIEWTTEDGSKETLWIDEPSADSSAVPATDWDGRQV